MATIKNPTLILGLGGTGFLTASKIKSISQQIFQDNHPDSLRFLCIDFDKSESNLRAYSKVFTEEKSPLEASDPKSKEWIRISSGRDVDYEKELRANKDNKSDADLRFFESDEKKKNDLLNTIGSFDLTEGAGQKRILGKIGISYSTNYEKVQEEIKAALAPLVTANIKGVKDWSTVSVYVINSFSGGTGAGIFLDILFILSEIYIAGKKLEIFTFNFMPDIFLNRLSSNISKNLIEPNTYAAITELEYIYSNVENFCPTYHEKPLGTRRKLPKANFLINQTSYNGSSLSLKSMVYTTAKTISNLLLAGNGLDSQWSNFQNEIAGDIRGKNRTFGSLGYTEIVFDQHKLMKYATGAVLTKAWEHYRNGQPVNDNSTINSEVDVFQQLSNFIENPIDNLLTGKEGEHFSQALSELEFKKPPVSKKQHERLRPTIELNRKNLENSIRNLTREHYNSNKLAELIDLTKERIKVSSFEQSKLNDQVINYKKELLEFKSSDKARQSLNVKKDTFQRKLDSLLNDIDRVPKRFKSIFGTKSEFYKTYLPGKVDSIKNEITLAYRELIVEEELLRLIDNNIENSLARLSGVENQDYKKLEWINKNIAEIEMPENFDNVIFLESFFKNDIDCLIDTDPDINAGLIKKYLSGNNSFLECIQNLQAVQRVNELSYKNIYELKKELEGERVDYIVKKVDELIEPLWDRANANQINNGRINFGGNGNLPTYKRLEIPKLKDGGIGEYFGQDTFSIKEGDIYPSENIHRQSVIKLELGLPAYLVKSVERYKSTYHDVVERIPNQSVNFFTYNEIREKYNNREIGIYRFEDEHEHEKKQRALYAWSFGWALKLISKEQGRYKFKVSENFKPIEEDRHKLNNGLFDPFKDLGTSADLKKLFNLFKEDHLLISDLERSINSERTKNAHNFLNLVAEAFSKSSTNNPTQKFKTEKKALSTLTDDERVFLDLEEETLRNGVDEIANAASIKIDWWKDDIDNERFRRLNVNVL